MVICILNFSITSAHFGIYNFFQKFTFQFILKCIVLFLIFFLFLNQFYLLLFPLLLSMLFLNFLLPELVYLLIFQRGKFCYNLCYQFFLNFIDFTHFFFLLCILIFPQLFDQLLIFFVLYFFLISVNTAIKFLLNAMLAVFHKI